jgi:4-carboxymuconolactone decarboxylase
MTRIAPLEPPYDSDTAELLRKMMPPGVEVPPLAVFRTLARLPIVGKRLAALGGALLGRGKLSLELRELAILRTTGRCGASYEWGVHVSWLAAAAGLGEGQVTNTTEVTLDRALWSGPQIAVLDACDALHDHATIDAASYAALREHIDEDTILELVVLAGFYHLISFVVRSCELPSEPWAASFAQPGRQRDAGLGGSAPS